MMRADRLIRIVMLLQRHHRLTAKVLAQHTGVTERTIYRDIEALGLAGIPVYTQTGPEGGCFLDERFRAGLNWFTGDELQALLYTGSASPLTALGLRQPMESAVLKLVALLPERYQQQADQMRQRLYFDPSGWFGNDDGRPDLTMLKQAVWENHVIEADYVTWAGEQQALVLAPYSLVYKADHWYLVAAKIPDEAMHVYRVTRLHDVRLQSTTFQRRMDFDIAAYWQTASADFLGKMPVYPVMLRIPSALMTVVEQVMSGRYSIIERDVESTLIRVQYTVFEEARTSVLGFGPSVDVIEPGELRDAVIAQARAIAAKYTL